jgi:hypothetical protein
MVWRIDCWQFGDPVAERRFAWRIGIARRSSDNL